VTATPGPGPLHRPAGAVGIAARVRPYGIHSSLRGGHLAAANLPAVRQRLLPLRSTEDHHVPASCPPDLPRVTASCADELIPAASGNDSGNNDSGNMVAADTGRGRIDEADLPTGPIIRTQLSAAPALATAGVSR